MQKLYSLLPPWRWWTALLPAIGGDSRWKIRSRSSTPRSGDCVVLIVSVRRRLIRRARCVTALGLILLGGCASVPEVDSFGLPHFAYAPLRDAGIDDRRQSFARIFCTLLGSDLGTAFSHRPCTDFLHLEAAVETTPQLPELDPALPLKVIVVSGFLGDCIAQFSTPFEDARAALLAEGVEIEQLIVGGRASTAHNAAIIAERLGSPEIRHGPKVVLIGYSKGLPDILEALPLVPGGTDHVAAVAGVAGVVNGTPLADEQSGFMRGFIDGLPLKGCPASAGDGDALASLTYAYRQAWLDEHPLIGGIRYYSIAAYGSVDDMSRVNRKTYRKLAHLDDRNDGQVIYRDALIPGGTLLAFPRADHLAVALPLDADNGFLLRQAIDRNAYPRTVLLKSILIAVQQDLLP